MEVTLGIHALFINAEFFTSNPPPISAALPFIARESKQKHCAFVAVRTQKTGAGAVSMTVPSPVSTVFSYFEGYFAPESMKKPLLSW